MFSLITILSDEVNDISRVRENVLYLYCKIDFESYINPSNRLTIMNTEYS